MNAPVKHPSTTLLRQPLRMDTVLLLDTSGSMAEGQPRRIDLLWRAVQALRTPQAHWRIAPFNTRCQWSPAVRFLSRTERLTSLGLSR